MNPPQESYHEHKVKAADCPIHKVTVYTDQAVIERSVDFPIPSDGDGDVIKIIVEGLPKGLKSETLRVESTGMRIRDVAYSLVKEKRRIGEDDPQVQEMQDCLASLRLEETRIAKDRALLEAYATRVGGDGGKPNVSIDPSAFFAFASEYEARGRDLAQKERTNADSIKHLDQKMRERVSGINSSLDTEWARISVEMEMRGVFTKSTGDLTITYGISGASWEPKYDIRASSEGSDVEFVYGAMITQRTGEDWSAVDLSLSTTQPAQHGEIPLFPSEAPKIYADFARGIFFGQTPDTILSPPAPAPPGGRSGPACPNPGSAAPPPPPPPPPPVSAFGAPCPPGSRPRVAAVPAPAAALGFSAFAAPSPAEVLLLSEDEEDVEDDDDGDDALPITPQGKDRSFSVPSKRSIPSDGASHRVILSERSLRARLFHVVHPRLAQHAYLKAKVWNAGGIELLPGRLRVYVDGGYVADTSLPYVGSEAEFECALGVDPRVRVHYGERRRKIAAEGFLANHETLSVSRSARIRNGRTHPIRLRVVEQIPESAMEDRVRVSLLSPKNPKSDAKADSKADHKSVPKKDRPTDDVQDGVSHDTRNGCLVWRVEAMPVGEEREFLTRYTITSPARSTLRFD